MKVVQVNLTDKQLEAFDYLEDNETTELFYGGGAGGGKSFLGCFWIACSCLKYPGTRYLMGRAKLKTLKESTLLTLFSVLKLLGQKAGEDFKYNAMEGTVKFSNESAIFLKDLFAYPSDPEFDSLGSTEYTYAFVDEVSEVTEKAKNIVMSRLRYKLEEYALLPKLLMASNPAKNFAYREYWKPWKEGTLVSYRKFVPALVGDNPFISDYYAENLKKLDKNSRERLLYGNWNYDDDPSKLFDYDKINDIFTNGAVRGKPYLSADIARFGSDKAVFVIWDGYHIKEIVTTEKKSTAANAQMVNHLALLHGIPRSQIVIDEDGIGGGVVDDLPGVKGFINNSKAIELKRENTPISAYTLPPKHNFANLKTQCYFKLADLVHDGKISYNEDKPQIKEMIVEDLEHIKVKDPTKDGKISIIPKEDIIENLGRSPDVGDAIMMRMMFEFKPKLEHSIYGTRRF